ncbi:MAG: phage tail protein [Oscillospiraceae bacterium]|nr:phage tail protein [Oscillospiraceae bacterium]
MSMQSGAYFKVLLAGVGVIVKGDFTSVSGLGMEVEYEVFNEGGRNYPRFFMKDTKPQTLVLEQGVMTDADSVAVLMDMVNKGQCVPLAGVITMTDRYGKDQRTWVIEGAHLQKYVGPKLDANSSALAVSRMEFIYNGAL